MICRDYQLARVRFDTPNSPVDSLHCWSVRWSIASDFLRPWPEKAELERWLMNTVKVGRPKMGHWWDRGGTGGFGLISVARILILEHCFYGKCFSWVSQIRRIPWCLIFCQDITEHSWIFSLLHWGWIRPMVATCNQIRMWCYRAVLWRGVAQKPRYPRIHSWVGDFGSS